MTTAMPTVVVEAAFGSKATTSQASRVWTDISGYLRKGSTRRGRSDELDRINAGTMTLILDNRDGRFDPTYTSGAYYPNVKLGVPIRLRAKWPVPNIGGTTTLTTYDVWTGYAWSWVPQWTQGGQREEVVVVSCSDELASLGRGKYYRTGGRASELAGARIVDVLTQVWAGGTPDTTQIDAGEAYVEAIGTADAGGAVTNQLGALQHVQDAGLTDGGLVYIRKDGLFRFEGRRSRSNTKNNNLLIFGDAGTAQPFGIDWNVFAEPYTVGGTVDLQGGLYWNSVAAAGTVLLGGREVYHGTVDRANFRFVLTDVLGATGTAPLQGTVIFGEAPYTGLEPAYDESFLVNEWIATSNAGSATAIDTASGSAYFKRTNTRDTIAASGLELNSIATYLLGRYKDPVLRFPAIDVTPQAINGATWPWILLAEISSKVIVKRRPPGGRYWKADCYVEGISHDFTPDVWRTSFNVSPADMTDYWLVGVGALGSTLVGY